MKLILICVHFTLILKISYVICFFSTMNILKSSLAILFAALIATVSSNFNCLRIYGCAPRATNPVCTTEGTVQSNLCMAQLCKDETIDTTWKSCKNCPNNQFCTEKYAPVCGSDKIIYSNRCKLLRTSCQRKGRLREIAEYQCCKNTSQIDNKICGCRGLKIKDCISKCPTASNTKEKKVCGEDGQFYENECVLNCYKIKQAASPGECHKCYFICSNMYNPTCGSDGVVHSNKCVMAAEACKTKKRIVKKDLAFCCNKEEPDKNCPKPKTH